MATKTQALSASRAGLSSVIVADPGVNKTQIISNLGAVRSSSGVTFVIHPFP